MEFEWFEFILYTQEYETFRTKTLIRPFLNFPQFSNFETTVVKTSKFDISKLINNKVGHVAYQFNPLKRKTTFYALTNFVCYWFKNNS